MKAITLRQPWATLVAEGIKTIETRSFRTKHRGHIAIHAGLHPPTGERMAGWYAFPAAVTGRHARGTEWVLRHEPDNDGPLNGRRMPLGAVVATARIVDVVPMVGAGAAGGPSLLVPIVGLAEGTLWTWQAPHGPHRHPYLPWSDVTDQLPYGDYRPGRFAWLLDDICPLPVPVEAVGHLGLWDWHPGEAE